MKRSGGSKQTKEFAARVGRALRSAARIFGTPVYAWKGGKVVAEKPCVLPLMPAMADQ